MTSTVLLTFDFDAVSLWLGSMEARTPSAISRGEFGVVGVRRILALLERYGIAATFFVPGHTAETYPDATREIVAAGHEIGHHGYLHENPLGLKSRERERAVLERGLDALDRIADVRPTGYRSPAWDNSPYTVELLVELGFTKNSLMGDDFTPYRCRVGDVHDPVGAYRFGSAVDLVQLPVSWILDDFPHFEYLRADQRVYPGLSAPSKVKEIWRAEFDYMVNEVPNGVFTLTMHPQVIGRGHRMVMLERLISYMQGNSDAQFATCQEVAAAFRATYPVKNN